MSQADLRIERDSMGEVQVPKDALYAAQTQRAVNNFPISGLPMARPFLRALGMVKRAAAEVNKDLGELDAERAGAIAVAAQEVEEGLYDAQFPIDVFQTGSGTSTNMNANEVIARLATDKLQAAGKDLSVHPNDHVNMGQSSNDVIPTCLHVSTYLEVQDRLIPALLHLQGAIEKKAKSVDAVVKTGRTHLMDAMPIRMSQELLGWAQQITYSYQRLEDTLRRLVDLAQGGTAVGTGINAHEEFAVRFAARLTEYTTHPFQAQDVNRFTGLSCQDTTVEMSGQLKALAVALMKIANDLRWMNSGPQAGIGEIALPSLQPGSSIMPGKVNPVIPEAVAMVCAQVIGNDTTVTIAGQSGNFQLNVMLPVIAHNVLQSIDLLANASRVLADKAIEGFTVNEERITDLVDRNPSS
jgi:fumarate hydratase class II